MSAECGDLWGGSERATKSNVSVVVVIDGENKGETGSRRSSGKDPSFFVPGKYI